MGLSLGFSSCSIELYFFLCQYHTVLITVCFSCSVVSDSLQPHGLWPTRLLCPWGFPGKNTGVGSHSLLQKIFPTQGLNLGLLHCKRILYQLSHKGSPKQTVWIVKNALHTLPSAFKDLTGKRLLLRNSGLTETLELLIERKKQNEC